MSGLVQTELVLGCGLVVVVERTVYLAGVMYYIQLMNPRESGVFESLEHKKSKRETEESLLTTARELSV